MENNNANQLDISLLIKEYRGEVSSLSNDLIFQKVYSKQLEKKVEELEAKIKEIQSQLDEATTVVEHTKNV
jgi:archaellum component FlaC